MRAPILAISCVIGVLVLSGCTALAQPEKSTVSPTSTPDTNVAACAAIENLWADVEAWGVVEGNVDADGLPLAGGQPAPDYRIELDAIRQTTEGVVRTALDEYYERTPTHGAWWFGNGIHQAEYGDQVQAACENVGAPISFP